MKPFSRFALTVSEPSTRHEKTKATSDEKAGKVRESKSAVVAQITKVTTSKISLGRDNAAHACMNDQALAGYLNWFCSQPRKIQFEPAPVAEKSREYDRPAVVIPFPH
jgi:hypothetical protein